MQQPNTSSRINKWSLKRVRKATSNNATTKLSIGQREVSGRRTVELLGIPDSDCSDIIDEVIFVYIDNDTQLPVRNFVARYPFQIVIEDAELNGGFICATVGFTSISLAPQVISFNISTPLNVFLPFAFETPSRHLPNNLPAYTDSVVMQDLALQVQATCNHNLQRILKLLDTHIQPDVLSSPACDGMPF